MEYNDSIKQAIWVRSMIDKAMRRGDREVVVFLLGALMLLANQSGEVNQMVSGQEAELSEIVKKATGHTGQYYVDLMDALAREL